MNLKGKHANSRKKRLLRKWIYKLEIHLINIDPKRVYVLMNETHHSSVGFSLDRQLSNPFENRSVQSSITEYKITAS